jgi:hypothetical protein
VAAIVPPILVALIFAIIALLPLKPERLDYVGVAYIVFFPVLLLFIAGFGLAMGGVIEAFRTRRSVALALVMLTLNAWPVWLMARQFIPGWHP